MTRALSEIDYPPTFAGGVLPAMLTLTHPGKWVGSHGPAKWRKTTPKR